MARSRLFAELQLVNGSTGDPVLLMDYPDRDDALLLDAGDNSALSLDQLADLQAVFITHHHVDHFIGLDRIVRANIDADKTVSIIGPTGTIQKVYDRIRSYEYQFFPFQKIVLNVTDVTSDTIQWATLDCGRRFAQPEVLQKPRTGSVIFETETVAVEACDADHTVPCLSYAVTEKPGYYLDPHALAVGSLKPGLWIGDVLTLLRAGPPGERSLKIDGGIFQVKDLTTRYFKQSAGARLVFITDTMMSPAARPNLLKLAHRATRLYCDSFYLDAQKTSAEKHHHSTARQAAEFALEADVDELVLIHFAGRYKGRYDRLVDEARSVFPGAKAEIH